MRPDTANAVGFTKRDKQVIIKPKDGAGFLADMIHSEHAVISDNGIHNDYRVDYDLVNSKSYHDRFEGLTGHKVVDEALYKKAAAILEHRSGTDGEDIAIIDARTGELLVENFTAQVSFNTTLRLKF